MKTVQVSRGRHGSAMFEKEPLPFRTGTWLFLATLAIALGLTVVMAWTLLTF